MIDRVAPTRRPNRPVRGYQEWRSLLFMHWPVPAAALRLLVPAPLELDLYDGVAFVGVVPFAMQGVRPRWWPRQLAFQFLETNVRTYVCHRDQPGVYFLSLEAASQLAVWTARRFWGLPYCMADMSMERQGDEIRYHSRRRGSNQVHDVRYRLGAMLDLPKPGSLEYFFLERYLLFVKRGDKIYAGQVHHSPYPAQNVEVLSVKDELVSATGLGDLSGPPPFAHYAAGVDVEVFDLRPT